MGCVDLRTMTGYKLVNELTGRRAGKRDDAWELLIPGKYGDVSPFGGLMLVASTHGARKTSQILAVVPGAVVTQDGDDGQNVTFPVAHFDTVADILRLRKRRILSEADRLNRTDHLRRLKASANPHQEAS